VNYNRVHLYRSLRKKKGEKLFIQILINQSTSSKLPTNTAISHLPTDVLVVVQGPLQILDQLLQPFASCPKVSEDEDASSAAAEGEEDKNLSKMERAKQVLA
jgi:hypothetical protein